MIQIIFGEKGTGKTKRILDLANQTVREAKGSLVFIDDDNRYMFDLNHSIRFINASEYAIGSPKMFYGFISGLLASDFDLEYIFVDGLLSIIKHELSTLEDLFRELERYNVRFIFSVSGKDAALPDFMKDMVLT
ncbi:MAG: ATP-binding protein [Clostridiales bacterium]|nr:ATP-binding protein [Clostridiales bacterium]